MFGTDLTGFMNSAIREHCSHDWMNVVSDVQVSDTDTRTHHPASASSPSRSHLLTRKSMLKHSAVSMMSA